MPRVEDRPAGRINFVIVSLCLTVLVFFGAGRAPACAGDTPAPWLIAHAGGAIDGQAYTNSLEALEANYRRGFRFFEIDFSWTADGGLAAIHDWGEESDTFQSMFEVPDGMKIPSRAQFLRLRSTLGLTQLGLEEVLAWAKGKGDVRIVTDIKSDNIRALRKIRADFGDDAEYVIPQVYSYQEYHEAVGLGYPRIILTLYRMKIDPGELLRFARDHAPFAVTMPWRVARSGLAAALQSNDVRVYAHTVNDLPLLFSLKKAGVYGIYTDQIGPP